MYFDMMNFFAETAIGIVELLIYVQVVGEGKMQNVSRTPLWISPATSLAHNTSVLLASTVQCRHQVQYHLGLWRQLSFYDRPCILRALLPGPCAVRREALTPVRAIITERNTPFSQRKARNDKCSFVVSRKSAPLSPFGDHSENFRRL